MFLKTVLQKQEMAGLLEDNHQFVPIGEQNILNSLSDSILFGMFQFYLDAMILCCIQIHLILLVLIIFIESVIMLLFKLGTAHFAPGQGRRKQGG